MAMTSALSNIFSADRQRARFNNSNRIALPQEEPDEEQPVVSSSSASESVPVGTVTTRRARRSSNRRSEEAAASAVAAEEQQPQDEETGPPEEESVAESATPEPVVIDGFPVLSARTTMTLAELEEERELARRRSSICILLAAFVLFRLWVLAIQEGDVGLLLLCLVGTSWTARWISYNHEREEELDRRIANYLENSEPGTTEVDRNELRMLSFQAQLALAIMESQRQMMQGGYGHPDGGNQNPGVSEEAQSSWDRFKFKADASAEPNIAKGKYGSVSQKDELHDEAPHCSICLSEYEDGDDVVKLPCNHLYHDECISSWTSNHVKCPLCNFDLESVSGTESTSSPPSDSIV